MAQLRPLPHPSVPVVMPDRTMNSDWYLYFKSREMIGIANLSDVSTTAPANNEVLIYNSTTLKWTPGAN